MGRGSRSTGRRLGMAARAERALELAVGGLIVILTVGWVWVFVTGAPTPASAATLGGRSPMREATTAIATALTSGNAVSTAYLSDASLAAFADRILERQRGASGKLRARFQPADSLFHADSLPTGGEIRYATNADSAGTTRPPGAGVWRVVLAVGNAMRPVADFNLVTMLPFAAKKNGRIGTYFIGSWPSERGAKGPTKAPSDRYANPPGFIEVTRENKDTRVSEHFKLSDFLTHDQPNVWPKYLVLHTRLVDKLELVLADLEQHGIRTSGVRVMSGFRTPQYNEGGGNTGGRAELSRHMYGDASDIYIDSDGNGVMDDLNHDGRVDIGDSRVILAAADRVEAAHPDLIGGVGVYRAAAGHGPFTHIDTRGYRARW